MDLFTARREREVGPLVLLQSMGQMAQDICILFSTSPADSTVPGLSAGGAAVSDPDSPRAHGRVMVSLPTPAAVKWTVGTPGRGSDQELPGDRPALVFKTS